MSAGSVHSRARAARHVAAGALLVLLGGFLGLEGSRWLHAAAPAGSASSARGAAGSVAAAAPGAAAAASGRRAVPTVLPDLRLPDLSGRPVTLRDFAGHPLIVNFWASWCAPCRQEIPLLGRLKREYRGEGLRIVGVAVLDERSAVRRFLEHTPVAYPVLIAGQGGTGLLRRFGMQPVLPFSVFADARQRVIALKIGALHADEAAYILATMQRLSDGELTIAQARTRIASRLRAMAIARAKRRDGLG